MSEYMVRYSAEALRSLGESFRWGAERWGESEGVRWFNEIDAAILSRLSSMPFACPVAPESSAYNFEVRQLIFGRYRVLFRITDTLVYVLDVMGPFHRYREDVE